MGVGERALFPAAELGTSRLCQIGVILGIIPQNRLYLSLTDALLDSAFLQLFHPRAGHISAFSVEHYILGHSKLFHPRASCISACCVSYTQLFLPKARCIPAFPWGGVILCCFKLPLPEAGCISALVLLCYIQLVPSCLTTELATSLPSL